MLLEILNLSKLKKYNCESFAIFLLLMAGTVFISYVIFLNSVYESMIFYKARRCQQVPHFRSIEILCRIKNLATENRIYYKDG